MNAKKNIMITIVMSICLVMASITTSFAAVSSSISVVNGESQTLSEYDLIKGLQAKTDQELLEMGYEAPDVRELRQIDLEKYAKELKKTSTDVLRSQGYSEETINVIQKSDSTAEILSQTMGNVTYTVTAVKLTYSSGISELKAKVTWNWSSKPVQTLLDIVAITTNKDFYRISGADYNSTTIKYYKKGNKSTNPKSLSRSQSTKYSGTTTYSTIPMMVAYPSDTSDKDDLYYAMSGTMKVHMKDSGKISTVNVSGSYGHSFITCEPSVSVSGDASVSITFTPKLKVNTGEEATDSIDL